MLHKQRLSFCLFFFFMIVFFTLTSFNRNNYDINEFERGSITDIDGNEYETIKIGEQVWMLENLNVTSFRNGDPIPNIKDKNKWEILNTGAYCDYRNNTKFSSEYGKLYNWFAITDKRNIAPEGWHVPSVEDWEILIEYLGGKDIAGSRLKETGTVHWEEPNSGADNSSGFTALPGGIRYVTGKYYSKGSGGYWWTTDENDNDLGIAYHLYYFFGSIYKYDRHKELGISVRCVKD